MLKIYIIEIFSGLFLQWQHQCQSQPLQEILIDMSKVLRQVLSFTRGCVFINYFFLLLSISSKLGWKFSDFSAKMFRSGIIFSKISLCYLIRVGGEFTCANGQCISIFKRCNRSICVMLIKAVYQPYINHLY